MPCCLWCLKPLPNVRKGEEHLCDGGCRRAFREADVYWLTTVASAMEDPDFDLGAVQEGCP